MSVEWTGPYKSILDGLSEVEITSVFGNDEKFRCGGYMFHSFGFVRFYDASGKDICFIRADSILKMKVSKVSNIDLFCQQ